jgi:hypothetical protein
MDIDFVQVVSAQPLHDCRPQMHRTKDRAIDAHKMKDNLTIRYIFTIGHDFAPVNEAISDLIFRSNLCQG